MVREHFAVRIFRETCDLQIVKAYCIGGLGCVMEMGPGINPWPWEEMGRWGDGKCPWLGNNLQFEFLGKHAMSELLRHNEWWVRVRDLFHKFFSVKLY
jgi:hypothetical protein